MRGVAPPAYSHLAGLSDLFYAKTTTTTTTRAGEEYYWVGEGEEGERGQVCAEEGEEDSASVRKTWLLSAGDVRERRRRDSGMQAGQYI